MSRRSEKEPNRVEELLADWELARLEGRELSAEELAKNEPELLDAIRDGIGVLKSMSWVMEERDESLPPRLSEDTPDVLPESSLSAGSFLAAIEDNRLIPSDQLNQLAKQRSNEQTPGTAGALAEDLVQQGLLTAYQAGALLTQRDTPLLLDRYIILDVIGAGGMGLVFKALHRSMERIVALKILPKESVDSPDKVERFRREIKTVAKLSHPNIAAAHDAHEAEGTHFLVMEYVPGTNLYDLVGQSGPLPAQQAVTITKRIAGALEEAHSQGIIHRDVKPSNVMLSDDGVPKLLDLGIARVQQPAREAESLTADGIPVGTVAYIAPEQIQGAADIDARADIYSLGCTLFFLLTGRPLFNKKSGVQVVAAHLTEEPPSLREAGQELPAALERAFERMVAKNPSDRFDSMGQVTAALAATGLVETQALSPTTSIASSLPRGQSYTQKSWKIAGAAFAVALLFAAVMLLGPYLSTDSDRSSSLPAASNSEASSARSSFVEQRDFARWVLANDGRLMARNRIGDWECETPDDLPGGSFEIVAVELEGESSEIDIRILKSLPQLSRLSFWGVKMQPADLSIVASLESVVNLELSDCGLTDQSMRTVASMRQLQQIDLSGNPLSDAAMSELVGLKKLASVNLRETGLTEEGLRLLGELPQLTELDISETQVSRKGFQQVGKLRALSSLSIDGLDLSANEIASLKGLAELTELNFGQVTMTDALVKAIAALPNLEMLGLPDSNLRDEQLLLLEEAPRLEMIDASETQLTDSGIERFEQQRPEVEVVWEEDEDEELED